MVEKNSEELQREIDKLKEEKRKRDWEKFWENYNEKYPNSKKLMDKFIDEIQRIYSEIGTQKLEALDQNFDSYNTTFNLYKDASGSIKGCQFAWLFLGRLINFATIESLKKFEEKYTERISEIGTLNKEIIELKKEVKVLNKFKKEFHQYRKTTVTPKGWR